MGYEHELARLETAVKRLRRQNWWMMGIVALVLTHAVWMAWRFYAGDCR